MKPKEDYGSNKKTSVQAFINEISSFLGFL